MERTVLSTFAISCVAGTKGVSGFVLWCMCMESAKRQCQTIYVSLRFLYKVLHVDEFALVGWSDEVDRRSQEGLVYIFQKAIAFVDGTCIKTFPQFTNYKQSCQYCGNHYFHCFNTLLWTDNYGGIIRFDMTLNGLENNRGLYNRWNPYKSPNQYFSPG